MKIYQNANGETCMEIDTFSGTRWAPGKRAFDAVDGESGIRFIIPADALASVVTILDFSYRKNGEVVRTPEDLVKLLERDANQYGEK